MGRTIQHLVLVRHGESEGDVRRAAWKRGEAVPTAKLPEEEETTAQGIRQCRRAGLWIQEHIVAAYGLTVFDGCYVSSALRSEQSAVALDLSVAVWQEDNCLDERNRGNARGLKPEQHKQLYPQSFEQMRIDPLHWAPPGGESILEVADRARQFMINIEGAEVVLAVTHRDWMWAAQLILEHLTETELLAVDTDEIHNAQIVHYTSINPKTGEQAPELLWKRSINPAHPESTDHWQTIATPERV